MTRVRLGAVEYLNARPLAFGLDRSPRFDLRFDLPSTCAELLHEHSIDVGLIPSIEYLRDDFRIVPDLAIASRGPVASVALYTTRAMRDVRSIAMDTSSRTSAALVRVLCARHFRIVPVLEAHGPDLDLMLASCDAALMIGDKALFSEPRTVRLKADTTNEAESVGQQVDSTFVDKIDLGEVWTSLTGLPFVWAFWAGREGALTRDDVEALQRAKDAGVKESERIAAEYFAGAPDRQRVGARYLRDNIKYSLGPDEFSGLELFYRYATEAGVVTAPRALRFY